MNDERDLYLAAFAKYVNEDAVKREGEKGKNGCICPPGLFKMNLFCNVHASSFGSESRGMQRA